MTPIFAALLTELPDTPLYLCLGCDEIVPAESVYPAVAGAGTGVYFCATHYAQLVA